METVEHAPAPAAEPPAPAPRSGSATRAVSTVVVLLAATAAVLVRLPRLHRPASVDEAGFLIVGGGWRPGTSLYGDYWVDRPPLLIGLYRWAALHDGLESVRLLGCLAAALVVVVTALAAHRVGGPRAAGWTAVVAASWLASKHFDAQVVDGELLAAPFVAAGLYAVLVAASARRLGVALAAAAGSGVALVAALAVKQNMVDVAVFGVVVLVVSLVRRDLPVGRVAALLAAAIAGAAVAVVAVAVWAVSRGTSLSGLWYALYPFRLEARRVLGSEASARALRRKAELTDDVIWSGLVLAPLAGLVGLVRTRVDPVVAGLLVVLAYDAFSVLAGDSAWQHYLVQGIVPASLLVGVLVGRVPGVRLVGLVVAGAAVWSVLHQAAGPEKDPRRASAIGEVIAGSAEPGDTLVALYGRPGINLGAGLPSPYPDLWSLPIKVRDPGLRHLAAVLDGRDGDAPTWVVVYDSVRFVGQPYPDVEDALRDHYRVERDVYGGRVYLRDGLDRAPLPRLGPRD